MYQWFSNRFPRLFVFLALVSLAVFGANASRAADTYAVPQTVEVSLAWDANDPTPTGYRVYQRLDGQAYDNAQPVWEGTQTSCTIYNLEHGTTYYFVARAYLGDDESVNSNEVAYTTPPAPLTTYAITSSASANGSIAPSGTISVDQGSDQTFSIAPANGCYIADVRVDGVSVGAVASYTFEQVDADHSISAQFAISPHTIVASSGTGGVISPAGSVEVEHNAAQGFTISAGAGYQVADVRVDGVSVGPVASYRFDSVTGDHTIQAVFTARTFSISASAGANGRITPSGSVSVFYGGSQTFTITPDDGCVVADVRVDGVSLGDMQRYSFANISADHTIHAAFVRENQPPTADAGPDQTVDENSLVLLSGLNANDPDDGIARFQWRQIQGMEVELSAADEPEVRFTAPNVGSSGAALVFELTVTDFSGATSVDSCIVNVTWVNMAPEADAGPDQTVKEGTEVTIDASGSADADDGIAAYAWRQLLGPAVSLSDASSATPSFQTPNVGTDGASMTFEVTVTDAGGLQDTDTCLVNVTWVNTPPVADAGADQQVAMDDEVTLDGSRSFDADTDGALTYRWRQTNGIPVELSDTAAQMPVFIAPDAGEEGGVLTFELNVTDGQGLMGTDVCQVRVAPTEQPLDTVAPIVAIQMPTGDPLTTLSRKVNLSGTAADNVNVAKVVWKNSAGGSGTATGTTRWSIAGIQLRRGKNVITVTAFDPSGNAASATKTIYLLRLR